MFTSKPKIRTRTIAVPVKKPEPQRTLSSGTNGGVRTVSSGPPTSRYTLTQSTKVRTASYSGQPQSAPRKTSQSVSRLQQQERKRKATPVPQQWASSDESSDGEDSDRLGVGTRKRQKTSSSIEPMGMNRCLESDMKRRIRIQEATSTSEENGTSGPVSADSEKKVVAKRAKLIHGLKMSREQPAKYKPAFPGSEQNLVVELQYPSYSRPEKFETAVPTSAEDFNPLDDMYFSIEEIIQHYLPPDLSIELSSETAGTVRLLKRAVTKNSTEDFEAALKDFNTLIKSKLDDKTIHKTLDSLHAIPLSLTRCILAQVYRRTVSPDAHLLKRVNKDRKETTYGELLPPFVHMIFHQARLTSSCVFVDLGSGVGNVVLQSALQTGAESWGIEIMDTPAKFAEQQASELRARAKLWNISLGPINLLHGSFTDSTVIDDVLKRADVVLVNNKVFPQSLNEALLNKFLDLKDGCRVVSLQSFGGAGKQGVRNENSISGLFDEERFESGTQSVSWAGESVEYYVATKAR